MDGSNPLIIVFMWTEYSVSVLICGRLSFKTCSLHNGVSLSFSPQQKEEACVAEQDSAQWVDLSSIYFQFCLFYTAQYDKLWIILCGLYNLYTFDIPDLWPHIRKNFQEIEEKKLYGKKVKNPSGYKENNSVDPMKLLILM